MEQLTDELRSAFTDSGVLSSLEDEIKLALLAEAKIERFQFGETVLDEGGPIRGFFIILSGKARALISGEHGKEISLSVLGPSDYFGEMSIMQATSCRATVRAASELVVAVIPPEGLLRLAGAFSAFHSYLDSYAERRALQSFLAGIAGLRQLPPNAFKELSDKATRLKVAEGEEVVTQGEHSDPFYVVKEGRLKVLRKIEGTESCVGYLRGGDYFGELAALNEIERSASVVAECASELLVIEGAKFKKILNTHADLRDALEHHARLYSEHCSSIPLDFVLEEINREAQTRVDLPELPPVSGQPSWFRRIGPFPLVKQQQQNDCGLAALAMILKYFGSTATLSQIHSHVKLGEGVSLSTIGALAQKCGLDSNPLKITHDNISEVKTPALLHLQEGHWIVLVGHKGDRVRVADPRSGSKVLIVDDLLALTSGYAVEFDLPVGSRAKPIRTELSPFCSQGHYLLSLAFWEFYSSPLLGVLLFGFLLQSGLDPISSLLALSLPILNFPPRRRSREVRSDLIGKGIESFLDNEFAGRLVGRAASSRESFTDAIFTLYIVAPEILYLNFLGLICVLLLTDYSLEGAIFLLLSGALVQIAAAFMPLREHSGSPISEPIDSEEYFSVTLAGLEDSLKNQLYLAMREQVGVLQANTLFSSMADAFLFAVPLLALTAFWLLAGMTPSLPQVGVIVMTGSYSLMLFRSSALVRGLVMELPQLAEHREIFSESHEIRTAKAAVPSFSGEVETKGIKFSYSDEGHPVLRDISLQLPSKSLSILAGRSGAGKTTLLKLFGGLIGPDEGEVSYDRVAGNLLNQKELWRHVGWVPEDPFLFEATLEFNILCGNQLNQEKLDRIIELCGLAKLRLTLPDGMQSRLSSKDPRLTKGERQLVHLARALYKEPALLLVDRLDLDPDMERKLAARLDEFTGGRTTLMCSDDISLHKSAHNIFVLENGKLQESGTFDELKRRAGLYSHVYGTRFFNE